ITFTGGCQRTGGAMFIGSYGAPLIKNCRFTGNYAVIGGGIAVYYWAQPRVLDCTFTGNYADFGGGIYSYHSKGIYDNCLFQGNSSKRGGGARMYYSLFNFINCRFISNTAFERGGGIAVAESRFVDVLNTVVGCELMNNSSQHGGAINILNDTSRFKLVDSVVSGNHASEQGGGIYFYDIEFEITNCLFHSNTCDGAGGAMILRESLGSINNTTVAGNSALVAGGIEVSRWMSAKYSITNSIVAQNTPDGVLRKNTEIDVSYSNIQDGFDGQGNIQLDPMFVDCQNADFHLVQDFGNGVVSPCIDSGSCLAVDNKYSILGNIRSMTEYSTHRNADPDTGTLDMGYHYRITPFDPVLAIDISMGRHFCAGDHFRFKMTIYNPGDTLYNVPLVTAFQLDESTVLFLPSWSTTLDYETMDIPSGITYLRPIESFDWPRIDAIKNSNCWAYGAILTSDLTEIVGIPGVWHWGYGCK
ncbi:right-handed parallel beta-helix repeat-containing protein, partial [bacterium]|nr:right-handed parallel beta-helix repeat-containing protein [bacterium]